MTRDRNRDAEDWLLERTLRFVPRVRQMTDQELHDQARWVQMVINYADEADRIHAARQKEKD